MNMPLEICDDKMTLWRINESKLSEDYTLYGELFQSQKKRGSVNLLSGKMTVTLKGIDYLMHMFKYILALRIDRSVFRVLDWSLHVRRRQPTTSKRNAFALKFFST